MHLRPLRNPRSSLDDGHSGDNDKASPLHRRPTQRKFPLGVGRDARRYAVATSSGCRFLNGSPSETVNRSKPSRQQAPQVPQSSIENVGSHRSHARSSTSTAGAVFPGGLCCRQRKPDFPGTDHAHDPQCKSSELGQQRAEPVMGVRHSPKRRWRRNISNSISDCRRS